MSFLNKLLGRLQPASKETIQCCLERAEKERTMLEVTCINKKAYNGLFLRETPNEVILKCGNEFVGIGKKEIAKIAVSNKTTSFTTKDSTHATSDQKGFVDSLRSVPTIDPQFNTGIFKTTIDTTSLQELQNIFKKNKWVCYYDGKILKSEILQRSISVPKTVKYSLPQTGYYLCSIYAMKGKIPPILVMSSAVFITKELVDDIKSKPVPAEEIKHSSHSLIDLLHQEFKSDQPYKLSAVGDAIKMAGLDISSYGYSKLSDLFVSLQNEEIELGKDETNQMSVTFHWKNPTSVKVFPGRDEAWRTFLAAFSKTCQYNQDYPLAALTVELSSNGFHYEEFGFSKMLSCLLSFPQDSITISYDTNGHPLVNVKKSDSTDNQINENEETTKQIDGIVSLSRRGIISAYYLTRKMGFIIESPSNQTWWFDDSLINNQHLLHSLHEGITGQDIVFDGEDTVPEGKTYPAVSEIRAFSNILQKNKSLSSGENEKEESVDSTKELEQYSKFAIQQMAECPYEGIDARSLQTMSFSINDIKGVTFRLKELEKSSGYVPKELSKYYLTLATLHSKIDKDKNKISQNLRKFFGLQAEACLLDNNIPKEVTRFYCIEALRIADPRFQSSWRLLFLLFLSYEPTLSVSRGFKNADDVHNLLEKLAGTPHIQSIISDLPYLKKEIPHFFPTIMGEIKKIISVDENNLSEVDHQWKLIYPLCENIKSISGAVLAQARDGLLPLSHSLSVFDQQRYAQFLEIFSALIEYSQKRFFSDREILKLQIDQAVNEFLNDYKLRPTSLLAEALVPALRHLWKILNDDFQQMQNLMPELSVENVLETDGYTLTPSGTIELKLSICNLNEAAPPVESIELSLQDRPCQESYYPGILGGKKEKKEMSLIFTPSEKEVEDKAFSVNVMMSFRTRKGEKQAGPFPISIQLEKDTFEIILNPYLPYAGGNPIEASDNMMFFGRSSLVQEICEQLSHPYSGQCFVLYGQKRSGKTSVMRQIQNFLPSDAFYTQISAQAFNYNQDTLLSTFAKHVLDQVLDVADEKSIEIQNLPSPEYANSDPVLALKHISRALKKKGVNWIISIDEFTYIYSNARENAEAFMHAWKALLQGHVFNALIIGQDTMPQFKQAFPNDFCVSHDRRLNFLSEEDSIALASEPIAKEDGDSRYRGNSLTKVYQKTAGSPFFLQKFCSEIVKYLNKKGSSYITEADIDTISDNLVHGRVDSSLHKEDFEALVIAGDSQHSPVPEDTLWKVLTVIALHSPKKGWCSFSDLESIPDFMEAVKDLQNRDTIQVDNDEVRIRVELFADWLRINHKGIVE